MMYLCVIWRVNCVRIRKRKGAIMKGGMWDPGGTQMAGRGRKMNVTLSVVLYRGGEPFALISISLCT